MCESYLTKISRTCSCKYTKITECLGYNRESLPSFSEKMLVIWYSHVGMGLNSKI